MVDSNRIVSFDILKGGGILLVILGHIQIPYVNFQNWRID